MEFDKLNSSFRQVFAVYMGWEIRGKRRELYEWLRERNVPVICINDGYVLRSPESIPRYSAGHWAVSINGENSYTRNTFHECPPDRWEKLQSQGIKLLPWKKYRKNGVILVAHQDYEDWEGNNRCEYFKMILRSALKTRKIVRVRMHVKYKDKTLYVNDFPEFNGYSFELTHGDLCEYPIKEDLKDSYCLVTHDSNAAVDAVIHGIPIFTLGTSMADYVSKKDLDFNNRIFPDREKWLNYLAYQQWTREEIAQGLPFIYLLKERLPVIGS